MDKTLHAKRYHHESNFESFWAVASSFQFLVNSWTTIIELISIYKRLQAFEASIRDQPLPQIDQEFIESGLKET